MALSQTRQLTAVSAWKMPTCQTDLLLNQIKIVEQPGLGRHNALDRDLGSRDHIVRRQQHMFIIGQPGQQPVWPRMRVDFMLPYQHNGMTLKLLNAE